MYIQLVHPAVNTCILWSKELPVVTTTSSFIVVIENIAIMFFVSLGHLDMSCIQENYIHSVY